MLSVAPGQDLNKEPPGTSQQLYCLTQLGWLDKTMVEIRNYYIVNCQCEDRRMVYVAFWSEYFVVIVFPD
jgi:hypothetical protein